LAYVPAELVIAGVAALLYGLAPRAFALAWAAFGAITFIGLLGSGLQLSQWVLNLSPLTHVGNPPQGQIDHTALAWLSLVALGLTTSAFAAFRHRRVPQG
jgi:ABC-2 type transport system permease protein